MEEYVRSKVTIQTLGDIRYKTSRVNGDIVLTLLPDRTHLLTPEPEISVLRLNSSLDFYVAQRKDPISGAEHPELPFPELPEEPDPDEGGEGEEGEPELPEEPQEPEPEPEPVPVPTVPTEPEEPETPEEPEEEIEVPEFLEDGTANPAYEPKQEVEEDGIREGQQTEENSAEQ